MLALLDEAAGQVPGADERLDRPPAEQDASVSIEAQRARGRLRIGVGDEPAGRALDPVLVAAQLLAAAGTEGPARELSHPGNNRSPERGDEMHDQEEVRDA
jgi:hypothetical protein